MRRVSGEHLRGLRIPGTELNALWFGVQIPIDAAAGSVMSGRVALGFGAGLPPAPASGGGAPLPGGSADGGAGVDLLS